jgi:antitoxin (DNA-binding transcriptional repressor) of toxin-antitoxin stability system
MQALDAGMLDKRRPLMAIRAVARITPLAARRLHRDLVAVIKRLQREQKKTRADAGAPARPRRKLERYAMTIALVPKEDEAS